jgi:hypothetical protein
VPLVAVHWLEQPPSGEVRALAQMHVTLVVRNHTRGPQLVRVTASRFGNQRHSNLQPDWVQLSPGATRFIRYDLKRLGFEPLKLQSPGSLRAHVAVVAWEGTGRGWRQVTRDQSLSPKLYFHGEPSSSAFGSLLLVYDHVAKIQRFNAGDVRGAFTEHVRRDLAAITPIKFPAVLAAVIDAQDGSRRPDDLVSGGPGIGNHTFCVRIPFDTQDSGAGEDFYAGQGTQWVPASHARVAITNFNFGADSVVVDDGRLNANGCISFDHMPTSTVWGVIVISQADVPRSDIPAGLNRFYAFDSGGNVSTWYWHGDFGLPDSVEYFYLDGDPRANLFAAGAFSLIRFSDGLAGETIYAVDDHCPTAFDNSCNSLFTTIELEEIPVAYIHPDHNDHKFAISHEVGHAVVHRFMGDHPHKDNMYDLNTGAPDCIFQPGAAHALHSEEWSSSALTEGFAQFYATAVWNSTSESDGAFHYYKDDYKDGTVQDVDMASGPLGGEDAYLRNVCPGTDGEKAGHGVELDWSRQFWDYRTRPGHAPSNLEVLQQYRLALNAPGFFGWSNTNSWQSMFDGLQQFDADNGSHYLARWNATDHQNGIDF